VKSSSTVCVVSGDNTGRGLAVGKGFVLEEATVVIFGLNAKALEEAAKAIAMPVREYVIDLLGISQLCQIAMRGSGKVKIVVTDTNPPKFLPAERPMTEERGHGDQYVRKAQHFIEREFARPLTLSQIAVGVGMSPRNFLRRFKNSIGDSPITYLQRVRIETAKRKLKCESLSVDEVAYQVGYEDTRSFRRLFKRLTGFTPKEYRTRFTQEVRNGEHSGKQSFKFRVEATTTHTLKK